MGKNKSKGITFIIIIAIIVAVLVGIIIFLNVSPSSEINVYKVSDLMMSADKDSNVTNGVVTNSMSQRIKLEGEEKVAQIYVSKGQKVNVGDKLFTYDLRSLEVELKNTKLAVEKANVAIYNAQLELQKLKETEPVEKDKKEADDASVSDTLNQKVDGTMKPYKGNGKKNNPYTYLVASGATVSANYMKARCIQRPENRYEILEYREDNKIKGVLIYKIMFTFKMDGTFDFALSQTEKGFGIDVGEDGEYTASELSFAINQKQLEISNYELERKSSENDYAKIQNKIKNSTVYATVSGTLKTLNDEKQAKTTGEPFMEIIGKKGFYVEGYISELQLAEVKLNSIVKVKNIADNVNCNGAVVAISTYPSDEEAENNAGNSNVSYYPFTVSVSSKENLKIGDKVEIYLRENSDEIHYILKSFVMSDDTGKSFVMAENKKGELEQRYVDTGSTLYGEYIEVISGLDDNDWLAFPYEKNAKAGTKTNHSTQQELFGEMY